MVPLIVSSKILLISLETDTFLSSPKYSANWKMVLITLCGLLKPLLYILRVIHEIISISYIKANIKEKNND